MVLALDLNICLETWTPVLPNRKEKQRIGRDMELPSNLINLTSWTKLCQHTKLQLMYCKLMLHSTRYNNGVTFTFQTLVLNTLNITMSCVKWCWYFMIVEALQLIYKRSTHLWDMQTKLSWFSHRLRIAGTVSSDILEIIQLPRMAFKWCSWNSWLKQHRNDLKMITKNSRSKILKPLEKYL